MGCGNSTQVRRLNTSPIINRDKNAEESKQDQNQWHISKSEEEKKMNVDDWNFAEDLPGNISINST